MPDGSSDGNIGHVLLAPQRADQARKNGMEEAGKTAEPKLSLESRNPKPGTRRAVRPFPQYRPIWRKDAGNLAKRRAEAKGFGDRAGRPRGTVKFKTASRSP